MDVLVWILSWAQGWPSPPSSRGCVRTRCRSRVGAASATWRRDRPARRRELHGVDTRLEKVLLQLLTLSAHNERRIARDASLYRQPVHGEERLDERDGLIDHVENVGIVRGRFLASGSPPMPGARYSSGQQIIRICRLTSLRRVARCPCVDGGDELP